MNLLTVTMFGVGAIFIRAAIKDMNPKDVVLEAFGQNPNKVMEGKKGGGTFSGPGVVRVVSDTDDMQDIPSVPYPITSV